MANGWWSYSDMEEIKNSFLNGKNPKEIANEREENELAVTMYLSAFWRNMTIWNI